METAITVNLSPIQILLSLAFQIWIIVFPILILRKLNHLIQLLQPQEESDEESS